MPHPPSWLPPRARLRAGRSGTARRFRLERMESVRADLSAARACVGRCPAPWQHPGGGGRLRWRLLCVDGHALGVPPFTVLAVRAARTASRLYLVALGDSRSEGMLPCLAHARTVSGVTRRCFAKSRVVIHSVARSICDTPGGASRVARPRIPGAYLPMNPDTHRYPCNLACFGADRGNRITLCRRLLSLFPAPSLEDWPPFRPFAFPDPLPEGPAFEPVPGSAFGASPSPRDPRDRSDWRASEPVESVPKLGVELSCHLGTFSTEEERSQ